MGTLWASSQVIETAQELLPSQSRGYDRVLVPHLCIALNQGPLELKKLGSSGQL